MHNVNLQQARDPDRIAHDYLSKPASWPSRPTARSSSARATPWSSSPPAAPPTPREGIDFLPLTVDYREYTYASGRIPGGFFKREGKPSEKEVLTSRLIDRPIRPLFPAGWRYETQIIALLMSADTENDADVLAITGASAALALSEIPFEKTIAGVRVGIVERRSSSSTRPTSSASRARSTSSSPAARDGILMVEAGAKEVTEAQVVGALDAAHAAIKQIVAAIDELKAASARRSWRSPKKEIGHDFYREVEEKVYVPLSEAMRIRDKLENYASVDQVLDDLIASMPRERRPSARARRSTSSRS